MFVLELNWEHPCSISNPVLWRLFCTLTHRVSDDCPEWWTERYVYATLAANFERKPSWTSPPTRPQTSA